jgi:transposase, IS5 family
VATKTEAAKPAAFSKVIVRHCAAESGRPSRRSQTDASRARKTGGACQKQGVALRQACQRVGKYALIAYQRYAHAKQFERARRELRRLRTMLGRLMRAVARKIRARRPFDIFTKPLWVADR